MNDETFGQWWAARSLPSGSVGPGPHHPLARWARAISRAWWRARWELGLITEHVTIPARSEAPEDWVGSILAVAEAEKILRGEETRHG